MSRGPEKAARGRYGEDFRPEIQRHLKHPAIVAYLDANDPGPLEEILYGRKPVPRSVRVALALLLMGYIRRRRGAPRRGARHASPWPTVTALVALMNKKGVKLTRAKEELARGGKYGSERTIERALQRCRIACDAAPRAPVIGYANKYRD